MKINHFINVKPSANQEKEKKKKRKVRRNVSQYMRHVVASEQKWCCKICSDLLNASYEVDHIIPLSQGGSNKRENLQALCRNCHGEKNNTRKNLILVARNKLRCIPIWE